MKLVDKIRATLPGDSSGLKMSTKVMVEDTLTMAAQRNKREVKLRFNSYVEARLTTEWLIEEGFEVTVNGIGSQAMVIVKF